MKFAFSTVACPDWTLEHVAAVAEQSGFTGVELRTMGHGPTTFACDPALTSSARLQSLLRSAGAEPCCLSTSLAFDAPIEPPILGYAISDHNKSAREGKAMVELAADLGCPMIRVFGFEFTDRERRVSAIDRIVSRLLQVADAGRARQVRVVIENGGSFTTSADLAELLDVADHPSLGAAYNIATAHAAGESPAYGINVLSDRLLLLKVKDLRNGKPCGLGEGTVPCRETIEAAAKAGYAGWTSFEFDRAWIKGPADPTQILTDAAKQLYQWTAKPVVSCAERKVVAAR